MLFVLHEKSLIERIKFLHFRHECIGTLSGLFVDIALAHHRLVASEFHEDIPVSHNTRRDCRAWSDSDGRDRHTVHRFCCTTANINDSGFLQRLLFLFSELFFYTFFIGPRKFKWVWVLFVTQIFRGHETFYWALVRPLSSSIYWTLFGGFEGGRCGRQRGRGDSAKATDFISALLPLFEIQRVWVRELDTQIFEFSQLFWTRCPVSRADTMIVHRFLADHSRLAIP